MSLTQVTPNNSPSNQMVEQASTSNRSRATPWIWAFVACALLGGSGVVRGVQERRHLDEMSQIEVSPFPIKLLPAQLGGWELLPDGEKTLDSKTMRITGGNDYVLRTYVDKLTGVSLVVLVLFGPAVPVLPHTPQVCYPANGFAPSDDALDRVIQTEDGSSVQFRSGVYSKTGGRSIIREVVYHSFRLDGLWSPSVGEGKKFPRRNPGIFKVQIQRRVAEGERRDRDDPIEQFVKVLIPEIEKQIKAASESTKSPGSSPP